MEILMEIIEIIMESFRLASFQPRSFQRQNNCQDHDKENDREPTSCRRRR